MGLEKEILLLPDRLVSNLFGNLSAQSHVRQGSVRYSKGVLYVLQGITSQSLVSGPIVYGIRYNEVLLPIQKIQALNYPV